MPTIKLPNNKQVSCDKGENLLDVANKENLDIPFGCIDGICGACIVKIKKGINNLSPKTEQENATLKMFDADKAQRLACQCKINGDVELNF